MAPGLPPPGGKGMWIWQPGRTDGGNPGAIVSRATAAGLTHLYVRTGSGWDGLQNGPFLDALLPLAHAAGLRVYGWDFPKLETVADDIDRAMATITHVGPGGHRLDGFAADIETPREGTRLSTQAVQIYGSVLRAEAGAGALLIAVVPRPSPQMLERYPYADVVAYFDAIAPMIYWLNREPGSDVADAMRELARYGKPLVPIGQAYDGAPEGGRPGVPPRAELLRFMEVAGQYGATGVSFWSWQEANDEAWNAIHDGPAFTPR
jgi:hypothetical protein